MSNSTIKSNWARCAFIMLALLWATTGWFVLRYGGFYTSHKYSQITTFVDGLGAIFMAYLFFCWQRLRWRWCCKVSRCGAMLMLHWVC